MKSCKSVAWVIAAACLLGLTTKSLGWTCPGFIENRGQIDGTVQYYAPGARASVYFTRDAVVLDLKQIQGSPGQVISRPGAIAGSVPEDAGIPSMTRGCAAYLRFEGANPASTIEARNELGTKFNYFRGNDPSGWRTNVPAYGEVVYHDLWPGVDVVFRNDRGRLTYEAISSSGGELDMVRFAWDGADRVVPMADGSVRIETGIGGLAVLLEETLGGRGTFQWADMNATEDPIVLDNPASLVWSTFLGGSGQDNVSDLVIDSAGRVIVTGLAASSDFPTTAGAYDPIFNGDADAFVSKFSASGDTLYWSTFIGGSSLDGGSDLAVGWRNILVLTGWTKSADFPVTEAYDRSFDGPSDAFVLCLSPRGDLVASTFLGGSSDDGGTAVTLDSSWNPVVIGGTTSADFPVSASAYDTTYNGDSDTFVAKLDSDLTHLMWSTFLGGSGTECERGLVLDSSGNPVLTGHTDSPDFPTTPAAFDTCYNGGYDAFVVKIAASGNALLWSSFLGGGGADAGTAVCLDPAGNLVLTGSTRSTDFPSTPGTYCPDFPGNYCTDTFVAKMSSSGSSLLWSTFLGGVNDGASAIVLHSSGNPLITGVTYHSHFPTTPDAYDACYNGSGDAFVALLSSSGSALCWSSFLGGAGDDQGRAIALDSSGNPVVSGITKSSGFPTTIGAYDTTYNGDYDVFISKFSLAYLADIPAGHSGGQPARLYGAFPDPFTTSTTVRFYLPERQLISIAVYDVRGLLVKTLVDDVTEPGTHQVVWDGRSDRNSVVGPGIYFCRMTAGGHTSSAKIVALR
jgi:hypothetical protein